MAGVNRALYKNNKIILEQFAATKKPCIFLSHRSLDKDMVEKISNYIKSLEIDVYFDKDDEVLQTADLMENDKLITECIQKGLQESTHIMCILSETTISSWWVPYEIGYGENLAREIVSIKLANLREENVPSYLKIRSCLNGWMDLEIYLDNIIRKYGILNESAYSIHKNKIYAFSSGNNHPLSKYFNK